MTSNSSESHLLTLLEYIGIDGMSDEESDNDSQGSFMWTSVPTWRSTDLNNFLRRVTPVPRNAGRRVERMSRNDSAITPPNLPINCYSARWIATHPRANALLREAKLAVGFGNG